MFGEALLHLKPERRLSLKVIDFFWHSIISTLFNDRKIKRYMIGLLLNMQHREINHEIPTKP
jgi:hypothetical protein